ncbi:hypothetical protein A9Q86_00025 [Flavobacteriales bacterium 33_180_T64]|nr:hypothetical protein A9Q86_00025 [Flavobacteriales bacterium 33_180_T64]
MGSYMYGQELPEVIPPSPTVANLMQFEEVPVSYYTGQPNISIPIYSKSINSELGINIALSYNTQGIKINSRSSWSGTGWSLFAGGTISRTVRGVPDESANNLAKGVLHLDNYWDYETLPDSLKLKYNWRAVGSSTNKNDTDVDLYQFNFLNYSGRFIIVKEGGNLVPKLISKSQNFKIEFVHNSYIMSSFIITDANGYKYTFDIIESTTSTPVTGSESQEGVQTIPSSGASADYIANSAWHLSSIKASNDVVLATFNYNDVSEDYLVSVNRSYNDIIEVDGLTIAQLLSNPYNLGQLKPKSTLSYFSTSTVTKKISNIVFRDSTKVFFDISASSHPETGGAVLNTIRIVDAKDPMNIIENKRFEFDYTDPLISNPSRLWLYGITETANGTHQDYKLEYYNEENLAEFDSIETDPWGYDSGIGSTTINCGTNSTFSGHKIETGLLTSIEYPTGGVKEFVFEHNSYSYIGDQIIDDDNYMINPNNSTVYHEYGNFSHQNQPAGSVFLVDTITLDFEQDVYISSNITSSNFPEDYRLELVSNNLSYSGLIEMGESCRIVKNVPAGTYQLNLRVVDLNIGHNIVVTTIVDYLDGNSNPAVEMIGGGVRIKDIIFKNNSSASTYEKKITYEYPNEQISGGLNNLATSSGTIDSKQDRLERNYTHNVTKRLFNLPVNNPGGFLPRVIQYKVREKGVNVELSQGSYVGYRHVKVSEENNGYSTYSYTSAYDYPSASSSFLLPHSSPRENLDYKRGLLLEQKVYDNSSPARILKKVSNLDATGLPNYYYDKEFISKSRYAYKQDGCEYMQFYDRYEDFRDTQPTPGLVPLCNGGLCIPTTSFNNCGGAISQIPTDFESGWAQLLGTTTTAYFYDGSTVSTKESRQEFEYNYDNYQISVQDSYFDELGASQHLKTQYYYPTGTSPIVTKLIALNKLNTVLETRTFRNGTLLGKTQNIYDEFAINQLLPQDIQVSKGSSALESRIEFKRYDTYGNPLEVNKVDGIPISYIWGYDNMYPVAKLVGVSFSEIETHLGTNFNAGSGALTAQQITTLKSNFLAAQISTYEYDTMVGITKMTDARGYFMTYHYDEFNRLIHVKDKDGNILSENEYNYKNQY